jgi:hypothetical protein
MGFLLVMVELVGERPHLAAFEPAQRDALVLLTHDVCDLTWLVALVAFGVLLAMLAVLAVIGELGLAVWLLLRGGAETPES